MPVNDEGEPAITEITRSDLEIQANYEATKKTYSISGNIYVTNIPGMEEDFPMGGLYVQYNSVPEPVTSKDPSADEDGHYIIENVPYDAEGKTLTMSLTGYKDITRTDIIKVEDNVVDCDLFIDFSAGEIQPISYSIIYNANSDTATGTMDPSVFNYEETPKLSKMSFINPSANFLG